MHQQPFKTLFAGYADDERDHSRSDGALPAGAPDLLEAPLAGPTSADRAALVREIGELRARFEAAQGRILDELRNLRDENERLEEENLRWKTLVGEYKQILNGR